MLTYWRSRGTAWPAINVYRLEVALWHQGVLQQSVALEVALDRLQHPGVQRLLADCCRGHGVPTMLTLSA